MGQLDEAIRAHLELKHKHGASEEELHAEEQEALGPVRREPPGQQTAEPEDDEELAAELEAEHGAEAEAEAAGAYEERSVPEPYSYDEPLEDLPPEVFHEPADPLAEPGFDQVEAAGEGPETVELSEGIEAADPAEPLDPTAPAQPDPMEVGETPARGFDAVEEPEPEEDEEGEDVLEETPDFLQETPEHDRLWFEQKPPRDFDFDE